ncbi:HNH endonuclease [Gracilibacillus thailandensis]|uniref:HNH endonuclease n=1 Tax=Gracilibacillus thailandensis TaxID=563735 RepID=A0A6N7QVE7_9BACI|nr:HNH endonuclease [Gracilibacillus thailandensis]MRI65122.1 HNH endonuclease [Gracilibacillus thailandensis]
MPAVPKPQHKRRVPKRGQITKITKKAREEVIRRSGWKCEKCGRTSSYAFEVAHLQSAAHLGSGNDPSNLILVCGPSVNSGTCHNWLDYTQEGREWRKQKKRELEGYYERQNH